MASHEHEKQAAMDLAEDSRETSWDHPSFVAELFKGNFRWELISPYPEQDPEDKRIGDAFMEKVRVVMEKYIDPEKVDREEEVPREALRALADIGCFGIKIPKEYGGLGMSQTNYNRIVSYIATYCASTSVYISSHLSIGVPQPLKLFGTKAQKEKFMPRLAKGAMSAFALTEPSVGSDPAKMATTATPSEDGSYYLLNGEKLWCTNGPVAELLVVMAVTPPKIVNGKEKKQISAFVVETDTPGFEVVHVCRFMGVRGIRNGLLRFTNVKVPAENLIGKAGEGLKIALTTLNTGRLTVPGTCAGGGKAAMHHMRDWVNERVQWGAPIAKHQAVGKKLADTAAATFAMESINDLACALAERGDADIRLESAMAKYYCTETAWKVCDDVLQVRGGRGFETAASLRARGEKPFAVEMSMRNARISRIIEGTSEIMQLFIAREAMDTHVSRIMPIIAPRPGGPSKGSAIMNAFKFYSTWYPKTWLPAGGGSGVKHLSSANRDHLAYIGRTAKRLARTMFHTMAKFGPKLEKEQLILASFVDIGTELFAMAASLARAERLLEKNPGDQDLQNLVDYFCCSARDRIQHNFRLVSRNHYRVLNKVSNAYAEGKFAWMNDAIYTGTPTHFGKTPERSVSVDIPEHEQVPK
ncbi:MAG TPA: acyl-CoA dehydrogenase family protein [Candidatus Hydrogenedentes bacterium]|nr:acyl-CoA dehydrogenase family protein [Candidatus Hydrogenedentota bacterium]